VTAGEGWTVLEAVVSKTLKNGLCNVALFFFGCVNNCSGNTAGCLWYLRLRCNLTGGLIATAAADLAFCETGI
jgi:hypothetical protein